MRKSPRFPELLVAPWQRRLAAAVAAALALTTPARADQFFFFNPGGNWSDPNNWSTVTGPNGVPTAGDDAKFLGVQGTGAPYTVSVSGNAIANVEVDTSDLTFSLGGNLTISNNLTTDVQGFVRVTGTGTLTANAINLDELTIGKGATVTASSFMGEDAVVTGGTFNTGAFDQGGIQISQSGTVMSTTATLAINNGTSTLDDSNWTVSGAFAISNGFLTLQNGGSMASHSAMLTSSGCVIVKGSTWNVADDVTVTSSSGVSAGLDLESSAQSLIGGNLFVKDGGAVGVNFTSATGNALLNVFGKIDVDSGALVYLGKGAGINSVGVVTRASAETGGTMVLGATLTVAGRWINTGSFVIGESGQNDASDSNDLQILPAGQLVTSGDLIIGQGALFNTFSMGAGAVVKNVNAVLAQNLGSSTIAFIDGASAKWTNSGTLIVGDAGTANLTITDGGSVTDTDATVSDEAASKGTVSVNTGGSWTVNGSLVIGNSPLTNGAVTDGFGGHLTVTGPTIVVGSVQVGVGSLTLDNFQGKGTTFTFTGALEVGLNGTGTLNIFDGFQLNEGVQSFVLGGNATGIGTLVVSDADEASFKSSTQTTFKSASLTLGSLGQGTLTITNNGFVETTGVAVLADKAGSTGTATISGVGSHWQVDGNGTDLTIGGAATGTLTVSMSGQVLNKAAVLGRDANSTGTATLSDAGTIWHASSDFIVGQAGTGMVTVQTGATLQIGGDLTIGQNEGAEGTLTVDGATTKFIYTGTDVAIGSAGQGTLNVQNSGVVNFGGSDVTVGDEATGAGTLLVTGPNTLVETADFTIAGNGMGTVDIDNGATIKSGNTTLGDKANSNGLATITGASTWTLSSLTVGGGGTGLLEIESGATVSVSGAELVLGDESTGNGTLNLSGAGTSLKYTGEIKIGGSGTGTFSVQSGASFTAFKVNVGDAPGSNGTLSIGGSGTRMEVQQDFNVGEQGTGTLNVTNGANLLNDTDATLADLTGSNATVTIDTGSTWNIGGDLSAGHQGSATLTISAASTVSAHNVMVGEIGGSGGTITVTGMNSHLEASTLQIGGSATAAGGTGHVVLASGATAHVASTVNLWSQGTLDVTGGGLTIGSTGSLATMGSVLINSGGLLTGDGLVTGNVMNSAGVVSPGHAPGTLNIHGDYTQSAGGTLDIQITGNALGQAALLSVTGNATIDGTLEVDFLGGFKPTTGQTFDFLNFSALTGQFANVEITGLAPGFQFLLTPASSSLTLVAESNGGASTEFLVPLGPNLLLTAAGAGQTIHFLGGTLESTGTKIASNLVILDAAGGTFQTDAAALTTMSGVISGPGALTKTGTGRLTLTGANTYTGGTTIKAGTVAINNAKALGAGDVTSNATLLSTMTLTLANPNITLAGGSVTSAASGMILTLSPSASLSMGSAAGGNVVFGSTGNTGIVVVGSVPTTNVFAASNLEVAFGTLRNGGGLSAFTAGLASTKVDTGATLDVHDTSITVNQLLGSGAVTLGTNAATALTVNSGTDAGVISGAGQLDKETAGTLVLTGTNTYTGHTTINGGTLEVDGSLAAASVVSIGTAGTLSGKGTVHGPATLTGGGNIAFSTGGNIAGTLGVTGGNWSGVGTATGLVTASAGTFTLNGSLTAPAGLAVTGGSLTGTGILTAKLTYTSSTNSTFGGVIAGTASTVTLNNAATTLTLTGINTYAGATAVTGGDLEVDGSLAAGSTVAIGTNGTLSGTGTVLGKATLTGNGVINFGAGGRIASTLAITGGNWDGAGTVTGAVTSSNGNFNLGAGADLTAPAGLAVTGGTLSGNGTLTGNLNYTSSASSTFSGVIANGVAASTLTMNKAASTLIVTGANTYTGVTTISAGTLQLGDGTTTNSALGSGNLTASGTGILALDLPSGSTFSRNVSVAAAGASVKAAQSETTTLNGLISGLGGLIQSGSGTTIVTSAQTYTGVTSVTGGILQVDSSLAAASTVNVAAGGTLAGTGTIGGPVNVLAGGTLSSGDSSGPGLLTVGKLVLSAGSYSDFRLAAPAGTNDQVQVNGNLTLAGNLNVTALGGFGLGSYTLFNYTGTLTNTGFSGINGTAGYTVQVVTGVLHQVSLQVTSMGLVTQYWDGAGVTGNGVISGGSGTWNSTTTNWTTSDGLANSTWQGGVAVFDVPGGTVTLAAPINAQGLTFGSTGYTLSGTSPLNLVGTLAAPPTISVGSGFTTTIGAPVTGITGFSANGSGTLILTSVTNSYTGGTTIANGTVQIGTTAVGGSMGGGTISIANGGTLSLVNLHGNVLASNVTNGVGSTGTLIVSATTANTLSGALTDGASGNLALTQSGTGTTTLTNAGNSFSGATTISKGILQIGTVAAAGSLGVTSAVSVNNGTTLSIVNVAGGTLANNISNGSSGTGLVNVASTGSNTLNGVLTNGTGVLALTQSGTGVTTLTGSDTYTGATTVSAGTLQIGNGTTGNIASTSAVTVIGTGTLATDLADTSAFSNSVNLNAAGASLKAVQTVTNTITGVISGTGVVKQTGTGTTVLTAANTYKGGTTVSGGTLLVNNVSGSGTGTGAVAINNGGTLGGTGAIAGATTLNNGGTLFPGSGSMGTPGTILHATSMIWNSGGTLTLQLGSSANDALALTGALTKGSAGAYTLDILDDGGIPLGNYTLATFASTTFAPANFTLEMPLGYAGQLTKTSTSLILDVESGSGQLPAHSESADLTMAADPAGTPMQTIDSDNSSLSVTPTPEPSSALLLAFGGCVLLSWRRRRNG